MKFKQTTLQTYMACKRFRNYVKQLRQNNLSLNDSEVGSFASELGLSIWDMERILNEQ